MVDRHPQVCVIDDDEDIREALRFVLELEGYGVVEAKDGDEALRRVREACPRCSVILLDLMMPHASGWDFRRRQLEDPDIADVPVIVLSGAHGLAKSAAELNASGYLQKPIDVTQLIAMIERHRASPPPSPSSPVHG